MSIVGPRPRALRARLDGQVYRHIVDDYALRYAMKPGMIDGAGLRPPTAGADAADHGLRQVESDLFYMDNWSPLLDLYLIGRVPMALFERHSAGPLA
jgi:lipopolysaccharide/colanic/teichoic acid biosynthesis glycosyltransferase